MVHTLPDYTTKYRMTKIFGQIDSGELAARTGGISLFDRRGSYIWYDDFENIELDYNVTSNAGSAAHAISATHAWMGSASMKMTAGPNIASFNYLSKYVAPPPASSLGAEIMFLMPDEDVEIRLGMTFFTGSSSIESSINYNTKDEELKYYNSGGTFTVFDSVKLHQFSNLVWVHMKLVIDIPTEKYVRALAGNTEYSLSGISPKVSVNAAGPMLITTFGLLCYEAADIDVWCDNLIITQNEP